MSLANDLSSPPSTGSPASIDSMPETPVSPSAPNQTLGLPVSEAAPTATASGSASNTAAANKRKPSRRANTAERRATHNAVERQRRETLNSRFLDLAALLPNLSQIRRPSKSAIVNSSIAHIHSSRRHRAMAARELRLLKLESDALRRELNEWRDRAGLPRVEEPARSDGFGLVMSGEVEIIPIVPGLDDEEDGDEDDYPSAGPGAGPVPSSTSAVSPVDDEAYLAQAYAQAQMRRQGPMIVSTVPSVAFENPALPPSLYDAHPPHIPTGFQQQQQLQQQYLFDDKHAWSSQLLAAQQQMQLQQQHQVQQQQQQHHNQHNQHQHNQHHNQMQQGGFPSPTSPYGTPPSSGYGTPPGSAYGASPSGGFAGMTTTPTGAGGLFGRPSLYGSPVEDGDASSVSSGRTRSGSLNGFEDAAAHMFQKRMSGAGFAGGAANFQLMM